MKDGDWLLFLWLFLAFVFDVVVLGVAAYAVFWRGHSGWWLVFATVISIQPTLFKALGKRFGVEEEAN